MENEIRMPSKFYWAYLIGFFLVVAQILNVIPFWFIPIDWGKAIVSRVIISVLIFLFLWQVLSKKIELSYLKSKIKSARTPICLLTTLFVIYLLATIFSPNLHFSMWGNPDRSGGFVNFSFYIIFAILAFLIIKRNDWKKILNFLLIVSLFACLIAIFQKFGIFSKYLIPIQGRPSSVMGNPILLSIYLLLVTFLPFVFGLAEKNIYKKIFYYFSVFLSLFVSIFLVKTRGTYLGLLAGFLFFLFGYPKKKKLKIFVGIILATLILGAYPLKIYLDNHVYLYQKLPYFFSDPLDRTLSLFEGTKITEARVSAWKVAFNALKEKPLLGYGPENFMIAFDKYYDPSLPKIGQIASGEDLTEWFDRAHNFIFDISVTGGIPALIIYLSFFGILIWRLQKVKHNQNLQVKSESANNNPLIAHGLQATFLGYLVALFSSFDSVSTYLISFLLIGYSLHLISCNSNPAASGIGPQIENIQNKLYKYRTPITSALFVFLIWFLWACNIKPLYINRQMNLATVNANSGGEIKCEKALNIINTIYPSIPNNIINSYLARRSTFIIFRCLNDLKKHQPEELVNQNIQTLKDTIEKSPQYAINWILTGEYINILIKEKNKLTENIFIDNEENKKLKNDVEYYFSKALELSPKRQLILKDWADTETVMGEYKSAEEKLQKCIDLNPSYPRCYWYMALNKGYQKDYEGFKKFSEIAKKMNYGIETQESLQEAVNMYIRNSDYNGLSEVYPKLIPLISDPLERAQLHASLAASYRELGQIQKAREEVLKIKDIIPLLPESQQQAVRNDVEEFLKVLK